MNELLKMAHSAIIKFLIFFNHESMKKKHILMCYTVILISKFIEINFHGLAVMSGKLYSKL